MVGDSASSQFVIIDDHFASPSSEDASRSTTGARDSAGAGTAKVTNHSGGDSSVPNSETNNVIPPLSHRRTPSPIIDVEEEPMDDEPSAAPAEGAAGDQHGDNAEPSGSGDDIRNVPPAAHTQTMPTVVENVSLVTLDSNIPHKYRNIYSFTESIPTERRVLISGRACNNRTIFRFLIQYCMLKFDDCV